MSAAGRLSEEDREYLRRSCERSGVPVTVEDQAAVAEAADLLRPAPAAEVIEEVAA